MVGWGYTGDSSCLLCRACIESQAHFFSCSFSRRLWQTVMRDCSIHNPPIDWDDLVLWSVAELGGKSLKAWIRKNYLGATVRHLWL
jgi:hypothetical protein